MQNNHKTHAKVAVQHHNNDIKEFNYNVLLLFLLD